MVNQNVKAIQSKSEIIRHFTDKQVTHALPTLSFTMNACSFAAEIQTHLGLDPCSEHKIKGIPSPMPGEQHCGKDPHPKV